MHREYMYISDYVKWLMLNIKLGKVFTGFYK